MSAFEFEKIADGSKCINECNILVDMPVWDITRFVTKRKCEKSKSRASTFLLRNLKLYISNGYETYRWCAKCINTCRDLVDFNCFGYNPFCHKTNLWI